MKNGEPHLVSILIATQNRHKFIPHLLDCIYSQTYPHHKIQLVVGDDGNYSSSHLFPKGTLFIRYPNKVPIGKKRNDLKKLAKGDIMVTMDDDDYYFPTYIEHVVDKLSENDNSGFAALKSAYVFYPNKWKIEISGPWETGWPGASYAFTKKYARHNHFDNRAGSGEEWLFTQNFRIKPVFLEPEKTMIVLSHKNNTSNKNTLSQRHEAELDISDFIKNKKTLNLYRSLALEVLNSGPKILHLRPIRK